MIWLFSFGFHLFLHLVCCPPLFGGRWGKSVVLVCISKSKNEGRKNSRNHRFFVIARAKLCTKNAGEE